MSRQERNSEAGDCCIAVDHLRTMGGMGMCFRIAPISPRIEGARSGAVPYCPRLGFLTSSGWDRVLQAESKINSESAVNKISARDNREVMLSFSIEIGVSWGPVSSSTQ